MLEAPAGPKSLIILFINYTKPWYQIQWKKNGNYSVFICNYTDNWLKFRESGKKYGDGDSLNWNFQSKIDH